MDILSTILVILAMVLLGYPLGKYIAKVFAGEKTLFDFFAPIENFFYRIAGIDPKQEMNWKQSLRALLVINAIWFIWAIVVLCTQGSIPIWNPDNIPSMEPTVSSRSGISPLGKAGRRPHRAAFGRALLSCLPVCLMWRTTTIPPSAPWLRSSSGDHGSPLVLPK